MKSIDRFRADPPFEQFGPNRHCSYFAFVPESDPFIIQIYDFLFCVIIGEHILWKDPAERRMNKIFQISFGDLGNPIF